MLQGSSSVTLCTFDLGLRPFRPMLVATTAARAVVQLGTQVGQFFQTVDWTDSPCL